MSKYARLEVFHPLVKFEKPGLMANTMEFADQFLSSPSGSMVSVRTSEWETYESRDTNFHPEPARALKFFQLSKLVNNIDSAGFALHMAKMNAERVIRARAFNGEEGFREDWVQCIHFDGLQIVASAINPKSSFLVLKSSEVSGDMPVFHDVNERAKIVSDAVRQVVCDSIDTSLLGQIPPVEGVIEDNLVGCVKLGSFSSSLTQEKAFSDFMSNLEKNILPARIGVGPVAINIHA